MPDAIYGDPSERLPWLANAASAPPPRQVIGNVRSLAGWAVAGMLLVGGTSYWLGTQTGQRAGSGEPEVSAPASPDATLRLPEPRTDVQPQVSIAGAPEVRPAPAPEVRVADPNVASQVRHRRPKLKREAPSPARRDRTVQEQPGRSAAGTTAANAPASANPAPIATAPAAARASSQPPRLWPSREVKGAAGRLVQIGAFGTRQQAKSGWRRMQRAYPAVGRLPAVVVEAQNSRGRKFYRFQIGTTSHAHSEVLCQRMERLKFSCAVIGLPWKAKIER